MIRTFVELSGESPGLAQLEAVAAAEALGGRPAVSSSVPTGVVAVELNEGADAVRLAQRLGLARRTMILVEGEHDVVRAAAREGAEGASASFRCLGRPSGSGDERLRALGRAYVDAGGRVDLDDPERRFWLSDDRSAGEQLFEEVAAVDRPAFARRRMPLLPFQRPVSLSPRLARAAANLARVGPRDRVLDPFLGTGALAAEAGLLGARIYGIDRDATMIRGAMRNLEFLGVTPSALVVGDARDVDFEETPLSFEAILTDPPYGRSSPTGGEAVGELVTRVLGRWGERLSAPARTVVIVPEGTPELSFGPRCVAAVSVRVHRSLTREFRVYERRDDR